MTITQEQINSTQNEIFDFDEFPAEVPLEAPSATASDSIAHLQFMRNATVFIEHRIPKFLTEVVPVWYLRDKLRETATAILSTVSQYIDSVQSLLQQNIDTERSERIGSDNDLSNMLVAERQQRISSDNTIQTQLTQEVVDRTAADTILGNSLVTETTARTNADNTLRNDLITESSTRASAVSVLQNALSTETQARVSNDNNLQMLISTEVADRTSVVNTIQTALSEETRTRVLANTDLQTSLTNEINARQIEDSTLQSKLTSEASARASGDSSLQNLINTEVSNRAAADNTLDMRLSTAIAEEVNTRTTQVQNLNDAVASIRLAFAPPIHLIMSVPYALGTPLPLDASGLLNGVTPTVGMRMLLTAQPDGTNNRVIVIDNVATGAYHFAPDNVVQGTQYNYISGGDYQGYSWVLTTPIDRDPVEGIDALNWSAIYRPDMNRGDNIYTRLEGNTIRFIPESTPRLLQEQVGMLPPLVYLLGDGGTGGTIQQNQATGDSFVIVDYAPLVRTLGLNLPVGTQHYYTQNIEYNNGGSYIGNAKITPINNDQVRVDFVGVETPRTLILVLGGLLPTSAQSLLMSPPAQVVAPAPNVNAPIARIVDLAGNENPMLSMAAATRYRITLSNYTGAVRFQWIKNGLPVGPTPVADASAFATPGLELTADSFGEPSLFGADAGAGQWLLEFRNPETNNLITRTGAATVGN